mmetsp:Transcript_7417/g.16585  ORF Transcript_7417/g.16585 Transcript_7417/m.16585 type:complete len:216 (-) Transcript_7417:309-956(-)
MSHRVSRAECSSVDANLSTSFGCNSGLRVVLFDVFTNPSSSWKLGTPKLFAAAFPPSRAFVGETEIITCPSFGAIRSGATNSGTNACAPTRSARALPYIVVVVARAAPPPSSSESSKLLSASSSPTARNAATSPAPCPRAAAHAFNAHASPRSHTALSSTSFAVSSTTPPSRSNNRITAPLPNRSTRATSRNPTLSRGANSRPASSTRPYSSTQS